MNRIVNQGTVLFLYWTLVAASFGETQTGSLSCPSSTLDDVPMSPVTCTGSHISGSLRSTAPCQPRDKVVAVPWPRNSSVDTMTPSHVTVTRCSGGCHSPHSCVSTTTQKRRIPVLLGRCPLGGGTCSKECATLKVEDHTSCSCACRQQEGSCSRDQQFDRDTCSCTCRDRSAMTSCLETGRSWDSSSCSCLCPPSKTCGGDQVLDLSTCGCVPNAVFMEIGTKAEQREERSEEQEDPLLLKWEYPVILTLASLNLLLISIIVVLARRHWTLRRRLKQQQPSHAAGSLTRNIYFPCPVARDEKPGRGEGGKGGVGSDIQLYPSDSDISSEQTTILARLQVFCRVYMAPLVGRHLYSLL